MKNKKERILMENLISRLYRIFSSFKHMPLFWKKVEVVAFKKSISKA